MSLPRPRLWHLLLALAALIVPLQAGALGEGEGAATMSVSATLDHCGVADGGIVCMIDVTWSGIEDADSYTATVTGPGGSVADMGTVGSGSGGGSTSLWVPYAGDGIYSVMITAWGEPDEEGNKPKLHEQEAESKLAPQDSGREPAADKPDERSPEPEPKPEPEQPAPEPAPEQPAPEPEPEPVPEPEPAPAPEPAPQTPAAPEPEPATGSAPAEGTRASADPTAPAPETAP